jgi:iron complex outermembrane receptor protein
VNGVINIITKNAKDTQGSLVSAAAGTLDRALVTARHGARVGEDAYVRAYGKYTNRDEVRTLADTGADDAWNNTQAGFRADWKQSAADNITMQGDVYSMHADFVWGLPSFVSPPVTAGAQREWAQGFNLLGRWNHEYSKESIFTLQTYFDHTRRSDVVYKDVIDQFDIEMQHVWTGFDRHEIIWGAGYRLIADDFRNTPYYSINNPNRNDNLISAFVQDKIALVPDEFFLTVGSKFEKNSYTKLEFQPSARLSWLINDRQTFWTAVSRAIKSPNRTLDDANLAVLAFPPGAENGFLSRFGSHSFDSEELTAYEIGYRIQPSNTVSVDATAFHNRYSDLILGVLGSPFAASNPLFPSPYAIYPVLPSNGNSASSHGFEITANWDVLPSWQLSGSYSYLKLKFSQQDALGFSFDGKEPQQQFNLRSTALLPYDLELNNVLYFTDSLTGARIPNYFRFDTRLGWKPMEGLELSLVGQNLLDSEHPEFSGFIYQNGSQIPRSVFGMVTVRF